MDYLHDDHPGILVVDGKRYYHVTGFLESMKHRENPEFSEAIRDEKSAKIAKEMGDVSALRWADLDAGKRPLTDPELARFERDAPALREKALLAKFSGPLGTRLLDARDVPESFRRVRDKLVENSRAPRTGPDPRARPPRPPIIRTVSRNRSPDR